MIVDKMNYFWWWSWWQRLTSIATITTFLSKFATVVLLTICLSRIVSISHSNNNCEEYRFVSLQTNVCFWAINSTWEQKASQKCYFSTTIISTTTPLDSICKCRDTIHKRHFKITLFLVRVRAHNLSNW